jgi:hypothetical protein
LQEAGKPTKAPTRSEPEEKDAEATGEQVAKRTNKEIFEEFYRKHDASKVGKVSDLLRDYPILDLMNAAKMKDEIWRGTSTVFAYVS